MITYTDTFLRSILSSTTTIAVVGISSRESQPSHYVAKYLKENGYSVIPVNPALDFVLGERCYPTLKDIPCPVHMVDCFRALEHIPSLVQEAIEIGAKSIWMQLGLSHDQASGQAESHGLSVVQDRCIKIEHHRLMRSDLMKQ